MLCFVQTLSGEMEAISERYYREEEVDVSELNRRVEKAEGILQALLQFCQRNSSRLDEKARQVRHLIIIVSVVVNKYILCPCRQCGSLRLIKFTLCKRSMNQLPIM